MWLMPLHMLGPKTPWRSRAAPPPLAPGLTPMTGLRVESNAGWLGYWTEAAPTAASVTLPVMELLCRTGKSRAFHTPERGSSSAEHCSGGDSCQKQEGPVPNPA